MFPTAQKCLTRPAVRNSRHSPETGDTGRRRAAGCRVVALCLVLALLAPAVRAGEAYPPEGFVDAATLIPDLAVDLRYFSSYNFTGRPVPGYAANRAVMTREAAAALARVQRDLRPSGLGLLIFDAYRPRRAVEYFVAWAADPADQRAKETHYPNVPKTVLFRRGYIAKRSAHSRGSTVDVTLYALDCPKQKGIPESRCLSDMGTDFDFFDPAAHFGDQSITPRQRANRALLRSVMLRHGFKPYAKEWWHFTLAREPFPATHFTFPVR